MTALLLYEGAGADLVAAIKYRNARSVLRWLGAAMAGPIDAGRYDVVTWAPTTAPRRRERGFDHGELLARAVARPLGLDTARLLRRIGRRPQTGLTKAQRRTNVAFAVRRAPPARVLVVDDVLTTGATLRAAAHALRTAGAVDVGAATAAHKP